MKVLISQPIPGPATQLLRDHGYCVEVLEANRGFETFLEKLSGAEGVITLLSDPIDKTALNSGLRLKVISNYAAGFNNIDIQECTSKKIVVTNTPDVLTDATADIAITLILMACRRIPEAMRLVAEKKFNGWKPDLLLGQELQRKNLGILGMGRIGNAVAKRAEALGMRILYHTLSGPKPQERYPHVSFESLLAESDVLSLHLPLSAKTRHMIGPEQINQMKKNAVIINTSRGPIIDEAALVLALKQGRIFAAGLDVFENEPSIHPDLFELPNVVLLPHIGSATVETRSEMGLMAARSLLESFAGKVPRYIVNPEVFLPQ